MVYAAAIPIFCPAPFFASVSAGSEKHFRLLHWHCSNTSTSTKSSIKLLLVTSFVFLWVKRVWRVAHVTNAWLRFILWLPQKMQMQTVTRQRIWVVWTWLHVSSCSDRSRDSDGLRTQLSRNRNSIPGRCRRFFFSPQRVDRLWDPPSLVSNGAPMALSPEVNKLRYEVDHLLHLWVEVKDTWSYTSTPHTLSWCGSYLSTVYSSLL
jgi:hypothetical protein